MAMYVAHSKAWKVFNRAKETAPMARGGRRGLGVLGKVNTGVKKQMNNTLHFWVREVGVGGGMPNT